MTKVLSVGGSIIVPDKPDTDFLGKFVAMCTAWLDEDKTRRLILVDIEGFIPLKYNHYICEDCLQNNSSNFNNQQPDGLVEIVDDSSIQSGDSVDMQKLVPEIQNNDNVQLDQHRKTVRMITHAHRLLSLC